MPLLPECTYLTQEMAENVTSKVKVFRSTLMDDKVLNVFVFSDNEHASCRMWTSIFKADAGLYFSTDIDLIPFPADYKPEQYDLYEEELRKFIQAYIGKKNIVWDVFDLSARKEEPRMNLVLANRHVKKSDLALWAQSGRSSRRSSSTSDASRSSSIVECMVTEGAELSVEGGSVKSRTPSSGSISSSSTQGSLEQDVGFISIESLRCQILSSSSLGQFQQLSSIGETEASSSSTSTSTSGDKLSRAMTRTLLHTGSSSSAEDLPLDEEAAPPPVKDKPPVEDKQQ